MNDPVAPGASLADLLRQYIKDVLTAHPAVGAILEEFRIGCVQCNVGTCRLQDVVTIHNLSAAQEAALFTRISQAVFPGAPVVLPPRAPAVTPARRRLSPPLQALVAEHDYIKRVLALLPRVTAAWTDSLTPAQREQVAQIIDFIRNFADRYHHAKEEDLLFKYFDAQTDILQVMCLEHERGRSHVRAVRDALAQGAVAPIREHLTAYGQLLAEHIRKEDEILYPWIDRQLSDAQVGRLSAQFQDVEATFGGQPAAYRSQVAMWEQQLTE